MQKFAVRLRSRAALVGLDPPICEDGSVHAHLAATTSREDFRRLAAEHRVVPVTRKVLADSETPLSAYRKLAADQIGRASCRERV